MTNSIHLTVRDHKPVRGIRAFAKDPANDRDSSQNRLSIIQDECNLEDFRDRDLKVSHLMTKLNGKGTETDG